MHFYRLCVQVVFSFFNRPIHRIFSGTENLFLYIDNALLHIIKQSRTTVNDVPDSQNLHDYIFLPVIDDLLSNLNTRLEVYSK